MACLTNYTVQCVDVSTRQKGCFLFDAKHWQATGQFLAVSPVLPDLDALYRWDSMNGNKRAIRRKVH